MPRIRALALCTASALVVAVPGSQAHACEGRGPWTCQQTAILAAADGDTSRAPEGAEGKPLPTDRGRAKRAGGDAAKQHGTSHPRHAAPTSSPGAPPVVARDSESSIAAQRFRAFINPLPLAINAVEALQVPRLDVGQLSSNTTLAAGSNAGQDHNGSTVSVAAGFPRELGEMRLPASNQSAAPDTASGAGKGLAASTVPAADERQAYSGQTRASNNGSSAPSWIALAFLAWGGLLTLGTALRMVIG